MDLPSAKKNVRLSCLFGRSIVLNHNVFLALLLSALYGCADAIWSGTVFAAYLKLINNNSNTAVGYVEAASGVAGLLSAVPVGFFADRYTRSSVIRLGGCCLVVAACCFTATLISVGDSSPEGSDQTQAFVLFLGTCFLWGLGGGVVNGPVQAL